MHIYTPGKRVNTFGIKDIHKKLLRREKEMETRIE